jgi:hypothetical protein
MSVDLVGDGDYPPGTVDRLQSAVLRLAEEKAAQTAETDRLRSAIVAHRDGMLARFAETGGDPNDQDLALWDALDEESP